MSRFYRFLGAVVVRRAGVLLTVSALLMVPLVYSTGALRMQTGLDTFVSSDTAMYRDYQTLEASFAGDETIMLVLSGDVLSVDTLRAELKLGDALLNDGRVEGIRSVASAVREAMRVGTGVGYIPANQGALDAAVGGLPAQLVAGLMPDSHYSFMLVQARPGLSADAVESLVERVDHMAGEADFPPGVGVQTMGDAQFAREMQEEMARSLVFMLVAVVLAMVGVLAAVFRHVRWRLLPLAGVVVGTVATFGVTALIGVPLTMASMAVFPLLIGIGIDYFIQVHNRVDEEVRAGKAAGQAVRDAIVMIGPPVGLSLLCGVLGFSALFGSPVPMMVQFGGLSILGMVLCFMAAMVFMAPLLYHVYGRRTSALPARRRDADAAESVRETGIERILGWLSLACARRPAPIVAVVLLLTVLGYSYDQKVGVSIDEEAYAPPDMPVLVQARKLASITGEEGSLQLLIRSDDVTSPAVLTWMDEFEQYVVDRHPSVAGSWSLAGVVKNATGGTVPGTAAQLDEVLRAVDSATLDAVADGTSLGVITFTLDAMSREGFRDLIDALEQDLEWVAPPPGTQATVTGEMVLMGSVLDPLTTGRYKMTFSGLLFIFLALLVVYRDWFKALIPVLPVVMVTGLSGGLMYVLRMEYTAVSATMGALIVGLGVEYFLLVMTRYYEERGKGALPEDAMRIASSRVGAALLSSGATTIGGFGALMLSSFPVLQTFGTVTVMIFGMLLLLTFTLLPAILVPLDRWRAGSKARASAGIFVREPVVQGGSGHDVC